MSTDLAALGLSVRSDGVVVATEHLDKFKKSSDEAAKGADNLGAKSGALTKLARAAAPLAAAMAAAFSLGGVISGIAQFDTAMSRVQAITGATGADLDALRQIAQDLGASTEFSAAQAADGLAFLGMAGFSAAESMAAIPAVLDLATAAGMGLAEAADTASNIMSAFGIAAADAADVTDVLAAASSRANTNVQQLGQAISTAGPIAATLAIGIEDTAAAIGIMSDAGIQGERAGTALRGVLASLAGPTTQALDALAKYGLTAADVDPATRSLADIMATLRAAGLSTADAFTLFGREAASGALVLIDGADRLREFGNELRSVEGAAAAMARIMRDNLQGDLNGLSSAVAGLIIVLGDAGLTAILRAVIQGMTEMVRVAASVADVVGGSVASAVQLLTDNLYVLASAAVALAATQIPALVAALTTKLIAVRAVTAGLTLMHVQMYAGVAASAILTGSMRTLGVAVALAGGPFGLFLALLAGGVTAAALFRDTTNTVAPIVNQANEAVDGINKVLATSSESALPAAARETLNLTNENIKLAKSAYAAAEAEVAKAQAIYEGTQFQLGVEQAFSPTGDYSQASEENQRAMMGFSNASARLSAAQKTLTDRVNEGQLSLSKATEALDGANKKAIELTVTSDNLGKAAGGAAKQGIDEVADAAKSAQDRMNDWASSMAGHFDGLVTRSKNLSGVLQSMARQLESTGWQMLFRGLSRGVFGGGGGFLGSLFAGFFDQGGTIPAGQVGIVGERGPEFVRGPAVVTSRADTARAMAGGAAGGVIDVVLHVPEGVTVQQATAIAGSVAVRVTQGGLAQNRQALPRQIDQLNARGR
jgi:TP901 family phage tail tape measure protein